MYYRFCNSNNPMSDWGHAMFCNNPIRNYHYGRNMFTFDGANAINIEDLKDKIIAALKVDIEDDFDNWNGPDLTYLLNLTPEEIYEGFNPQDIVNSAENWDTDLVGWIWDRVLEPMDIYAVTTQDGALVFDKSIINKAENIYLERKIYIWRIK